MKTNVASSPANRLQTGTVNVVSANPIALLQKYTVQRVINIAGLPHTTPGNYFVDAANAGQLISKAGATAPEPEPLYDKREDVSATDEALAVWKPRSVLVDKATLGLKRPDYEDEEAAVDGQGGKRNLQKQREYMEQETEIILKLLPAFKKHLITMVDAAAEEGGTAKIGTLGLNDCVGYATTLEALIRERIPAERGGMVGQRWTHKVRPDKKDAPFNFHGATVVASDGADAVTLEAHSGQEKLSAPVFHIRAGGIEGFASDNKEKAPGLFVENAEVDRNLLGALPEIRSFLQGDAWASANLPILKTSLAYNTASKPRTIEPEPERPVRKPVEEEEKKAPVTDLPKSASAGPSGNGAQASGGGGLSGFFSFLGRLFGK